MGGDSSSEKRVIELGEEREAEHEETTDYFFHKIGESVPLTPKDSSFDLQNPPSVPLAVSERFRLIFVANSNGFCVAKTAEVINLAKDIKSGRASSSVLDVSIVQVLIGRVSILSLSADSSTLAASVGGDIYFFSVKSLVDKEKEPRHTLSIESPNYVKYFFWTKKRDTSFVVLSNTGSLYVGDLQQPLKHVMDDVDAVEWSLKGEFLAVARKNIISILTLESDERKKTLLELKLGFVDANEGSFVVDSIQWIRLDCIVVGCLQQTVDGKEENYLVQFITCQNGEQITDASSSPVIFCLSDLFVNIVDDIMPFRHGPDLLLSYLETRQLAVLANKKNTDQHIVLVGWLDDSDSPAVIHIERDNWLPRIEIQENGDDNVLLAMCIDRASVYENVEVKLGEDDQMKLSPYCIFLCLTHEGKLVIFHFTSISGDSGTPSAVPVPNDEGTISTTGTPDLPTISVGQKDDKIKEVVSNLQSQDMNRDKCAAAGVDQKYLQKNREASYTDKYSTSIPDFDQTLTTGISTGMLIPTAKNQLEPRSLEDVDKRLQGGQLGLIGNEHAKQIPLKCFTGDASEVDAENFREAEKLDLVGHRYASDYPVGKSFPVNSDISQGEKSKNSLELDIISESGQSGPKGNEYIKQIPFKSSAADASKVDAVIFNEAEKPRHVGLSFGSDYPVGKNLSISANQSHGEKSINSVESDKRLGGGQSGPIGNDFSKQIPLTTFAADASKVNPENFIKAEKQKLVGLGSASGFPVGKSFPTSSNLSHSEKSKNSVELGNRESRSSRPAIFGDVLEQGTANLSGLSSSSMTKNVGRAISVPTNATTGIHSMQVQGSLLPRKAVSHAQPINMNPKSPSESAHSNFESLSKKYGNIKDMTSELDKLLQSIEEPGGFMDTCTNSQKLLENLEETMMVLCHKCITWQSLLREQGESIQNLLDNTVQVLARKIYIDGIVKQTRDKHYWDLWNRQKLSSELQMRRQSMINLSQSLISQLVELEKHFNTLELNNYGENNGVNLGRQSLRSKYAPSRQIQSLHGVHNSLNSQLAAAEQLSDCLSRQMSALSITSSSVKSDNVKDQLFKMIGISSESYAESSPHSQKVFNTDTPHVTPLFSPVPATIGNNFRSNQTVTNNHEPETARRRRDSFDQNWANFEPSKTTIKRTQRGNECPDVQRPSLFMDKRFSISSNAEGSVDAGHATHLGLFHDGRVVEDSSVNFLPRSSSRASRDKDIHEPSAFNVNYASVEQIVDKISLGAVTPDSSKYSGVLDLHFKKEPHQVATEQPDHEKPNDETRESIIFKERKPGFTFAQSGDDVQRAQSLVSPFSKITNSTPMSYNSKDYTSSKRASNFVEQKVSRSSPFGFGSSHETESSHTLSPDDQPAAVAQANGTQSSKAFTTSSMANLPTSFSSAAGSAVKSPFSSSSTATGQQFTSTIAAGSFHSTSDTWDKLSSASQPTSYTFSSASTMTSHSSISSSKYKEMAAASAMESSTNTIVKPLGIEQQSSGDKVLAGSTLSNAPSFKPADTLVSKSEEMSASSPLSFSINSPLKTPNLVHQIPASEVDAVIPQKELPKSELSWNISSFTNSSNISSTASASGNHLCPSTSPTQVSDVVSNAEAKTSSGVFCFPQTAQVSTCEDNKPIDSSVAPEEDEMEEEAPDTSQAADLSLGSLGGLGLGGSSGPSISSAFRSNPFGGATATTSAAVLSSSTDMAISSGQLFRPASFSFQPLQPSQQPPAPNTGGLLNFGTNNTVAPSGSSSSSLGQPAQIGGSGQQALGSVLGSFGQSRQLGPALPGSNHGVGGFLNNAASSSGGFSAVGGGFATAPSTGGFAGLSASGPGFGGGFASAAGAGGFATGGGFANLSTGGGFSGAAVTGGGFAGAVSGGGGFGAFGNQGGGGAAGGGFSSFGSGLGGKQPPPSLFTQIRK